MPTIAGLQPNWLRMLRAQELLQVVQADKALREIARRSRFSQSVFERDCLAAVHRYAEFVQLLPASEAHHHAHAGGLLAHTIEMLLAALTWRNGRLLPENAPIEQIDAQRDEWTLVVFYAALLHDIGKPLTDLRIQWRSRDMAEPVRWMPLAGSLPEIAQGRAQVEYLVAFAPKVERDYSAHARSPVMLLQRMASPTALSILARQPAAFEALNRYLSGQDRDSLVAQIVREADKASARRALASGSRARFATAQAVPLVDLLMQSLRSMLRSGTALPLNRSGGAGWVFDGSVWFVAKRVADATREWIRKHEPDEAVPGETKNDRLFDTWQEYGCIQLNPHTGQAVWYVTIHGKPVEEEGAQGGDASSDYRHQLTVLRFPLDKLFESPAHYPPQMAGMIEVHDKRKAAADEGTGAQALEPGPPANEEDHVDQAAAEPAAIREVLEPAAGAVRKDGFKAGDGKKRSQGSSSAVPPIKAPVFNRPKPEPKTDASSEVKRPVRAVSAQPTSRKLLQVPGMSPRRRPMAARRASSRTSTMPSTCSMRMTWPARWRCTCRGPIAKAHRYPRAS